MNYQGTAVSPGVVIGPVYRYQPFQPEIHPVPHGSPDQELMQYAEALGRAQAELEHLCERFRQAGDFEKAAIFTAHLEILLDETMEEGIQNSIQSGISAASAVHTVYGEYAAVLEGLNDPLIRERAADLRDVSSRILRCLAGKEGNLSALSQPVILVAKDLLPSDTATLEREHVLGIVAEVGGSTSHSAIIARSYEIPAVLGISGILSKLQDGQEIILDAVSGQLLTEFDDNLRAAYEEKRRKVLLKQANTNRYLNTQPVTPDGVRVEIELNIASAQPDELEYAKYTDGVGLFRSEFLYMGKSALPTEEEQFQAYRKVLMTYGQRPVTLRTLDIGGDKPLDSMDLPTEDNPFLGNRAIRLCFQHPEVFRTQLRAALRASVYGNLWLMFPMVASLDDVRKAKGYVNQVREELTKEGIPFSPDVKVGIMVEIPSIALMADQVAKEVDFASIGTNDLTQYCTAVDRGNPLITAYYQTYHPALFRLIGFVVRSFKAQGKPVGVCGEMGGDARSAAVLLGLGIRQLSMGAARVSGIKQLISTLSCRQAEEMAQRVCELPTEGEVMEYLNANLLL